MLGVITISILTVFILILAVIYLPEIKVGKFHFETFWLVALTGVVFLLLFGYVSLKEIYLNSTANSTINPLKILVIFISMTILSVVLDELGFFKKLAILALKKAKSKQIKIFMYLYLTISILTIFTSNDIIILTFTPFICYFTKNAKINPLPYLISEFVAANTWSMMLVIGNPTNIYLASSFQIGFLEYFQIMFLPTVISALFALMTVLLIFKKELNKPIITNENENYEFDLKDKKLVRIALIHLILCTILLAISSYIGLEMWYICLAFSISILVILYFYQRYYKKEQPIVLKNSLKRAPWSLIPFVLSMFVFVLTLNNYNITKSISAALNNFEPVFAYGISSFFSANIINNIPMTILYSDILKSVNGTNLAPAIYASVVGSNIGAYFTPIGALAGIMWMRILKKEGISLSFKRFIRYGLQIAFPTIIIALWVILLII